MLGKILSEHFLLLNFAKIKHKKKLFTYFWQGHFVTTIIPELSGKIQQQSDKVCHIPLTKARM